MNKKKEESSKSNKSRKIHRSIKFDQRVESSKVRRIQKGLVSASNVAKIRQQIYQSDFSTKKKKKE